MVTISNENYANVLAVVSKIDIIDRLLNTCRYVSIFITK